MTAVAGYELVSLVGRGPSGSVHLARTPGGTLVALKVIPVAGDQVLVRQLARQAAAVRAIGHPHLLAVHDVVMDRERAVIVADHAPGGSLASLLATEGRLAGEALGAWAAGAADALQALHDAGRVHGDLKPSNLLIGAAGQPLVSDAGLALLIGGATQGYSDPDADGDEPFDPRSDVYSLGVVCFEALSGELPFSDEVDLVARTRVGDGGVSPLGTLVREADPGLVKIIERAIVLDRSQRLASAAELAVGLRQARRGGLSDVVPPASPRPLRRSSPHGAGVATSKFGPSAVLRSAWGGSRARKAMTALALVGVMAVLASFARPARAQRAVAAEQGQATCRRIAPPTSGVAASDTRIAVSGAGCPDTIEWSGGVATVVPSRGGPLTRYSMGLATDVLLVGEWRCRPPATAALYRPSTGELFMFSSWARPGQELRVSAVRSSGVLDGSAMVRRNASCDRVVVRPR